MYEQKDGAKLSLKSLREENEPQRALVYLFSQFQRADQLKNSHSSSIFHELYTKAKPAVKVLS